MNMDEKDFPSCSDDSDADFVPKDEEEFNSDSGSEVSDCEDSEVEDKTAKSRKRKKRSRGTNKKAKKNESEDVQESIETREKEIDVDALWADFKKDVNKAESDKTKKETSEEKSEPETGNKSTGSSETSLQKNSTINKIRNVPSLPNRNRVGGLSSVLNKIGKKDKMSTLQKSQLDWNNFKKSEGIEEEIKLYNRGKDGYLDRQDFLQRADLRQFEIEKDLRSARRKF